MSAEERRRKERLVNIMLENLSLKEIAEWLWEDFGIRVPVLRSEKIRKAVMRSSEIRDRDVAAALVSRGVQISEEDWYGEK